MKTGNIGRGKDRICKDFADSVTLEEERKQSASAVERNKPSKVCFSDSVRRFIIG